MSVEAQLEALAVTMDDVPKNMRLFSLCMKALYAEKEISGSSDTARKMNKLRDDTRKDAMIYLSGILPLSTALVRKLKEFFEYYEQLGFEDWIKNLSDILEEVKGYKQCCEEVIAQHENIIISLKKREKDAKLVIAELKGLTEELERKKAELEKSASNKKSWAKWLAFVPYVNIIAMPILNMKADNDLAEATADGAQCLINNSAVVVVSETMIPALTAFIGGLEGIAGFFNVVEEEITIFEDKGERALKDPKNLHYIMMKKKAEEIKQSCKKFFAMIPGVRTDFLSISPSGSDMNYVDKWLKKQQEEIKRKYAKSFTGQLQNMLTYMSRHEGEKLLDKAED